MSKIAITILGTAAGVPTIERAHSSIYLSHDDGCEHSLLFDCGENTQRQLMKAHINMMKIEEIFITHWHGDHCLGLPGIVDTMGFEGRIRELDIYAPEVERAAKALRFTHSMGNFKVRLHNVPWKGNRVSNLFETERFKIVSIPAKHNVPCASYALVEKDKRSIDAEKAKAMGLPEKGELYQDLKSKGEIIFEGKKVRFDDVSSLKRGKKVVYSGDTEICANLKEIAREADLLIQDCTYFESMKPDRPYKHASLPEIIEMVSEIRVKEVVLTHVGRRHENTDELKSLIRNFPSFRVAEDFLTIVL